MQISFKLYPQARKRFLFLLTGYGRMLAYRPSHLFLNPVHAETGNSLLINDRIAGKLCRFADCFYR